MAQERLQKILAAAGVASRRKAEELITAGRISVNGENVTALGSKADARSDEIRLDGELLRGPERHVYIVLHKPKGYVTTVSDPEGRPTVLDLLTGVEARVFPVGRLDYASEGLLLLTNDGELMQQLTKAASHVPKTYQVKVSGTPTEEEIDKLRGGIHLPPETSRAGTMGGTLPGMPRRTQSEHTLPARIDLVRQQDNPWYEVTLTEGRNRQIRRMFEQIGHHVEKIKRVRYGALRLDVDPGKWRFLKPREVEALRNPKSAAEQPASAPESVAARLAQPPRDRSLSATRQTQREDARRGQRPEPRRECSLRARRPTPQVPRAESHAQAARRSPLRDAARAEERGPSFRSRQQRPESRRAERPFNRGPNSGSARERPSRPERGHGGPDRKGASNAESASRLRTKVAQSAFGGAQQCRDRRGSTGARPFNKARGPNGVRVEAKASSIDTLIGRPSRTPGRAPRRNKSGGKPRTGKRVFQVRNRFPG